eukprot:11798435-Prorocentrum_lima.AAC.1
MTSSLVGSEMCIRDSRVAKQSMNFAEICGYKATPEWWTNGPGSSMLPPVSYTHLTLPTICSV